jgi:hypothetical protein
MDHENLDRGEDDTSIDVLELGYHAFADMFRFLFVLRHVASEGVENGHSAPFGAFVECDEEFVEDRRCDVENRWVVGRYGRLGGCRGVDVG